jgi:hypothetical protein
MRGSRPHGDTPSGLRGHGMDLRWTGGQAAIVPSEGVAPCPKLSSGPSLCPLAWRRSGAARAPAHSKLT